MNSLIPIFLGIAVIIVCAILLSIYPDQLLLFVPLVAAILFVGYKILPGTLYKVK